MIQLLHYIITVVIVVESVRDNVFIVITITHACRLL